MSRADKHVFMAPVSELDDLRIAAYVECFVILDAFMRTNIAESCRKLCFAKQIVSFYEIW